MLSVARPESILVGLGTFRNFRKSDISPHFTIGDPIGAALGPGRLQERDGAESRAPAWFSGRDRPGSRRKLFPRHSSTTNLAPDP